jgi:ornithine cyclodeaminase
MRSSDILMVGGEQVRSLLEGKELEIIDKIGRAYQIHDNEQSSLPHSSFLLFPEQPANRIIALPAWLGGEVNSAGIKWIASFPGNIERGEDRASAVMILNSMETGEPKAIMEGSIISSHRTAASAALAARELWDQKGAQAGVVGCGLINYVIVRFLLAACPTIKTVLVYDIDPERAGNFRERCEDAFPGVTFKTAIALEHILRHTSLISFATNVGKPHIHDLSACAPGTVVLHISLRDLAPQLILANHNVVDDPDHVCRAQTSIHLAQQQTGHREFIGWTLGGILNRKNEPPRGKDKITIFSPFGLGVLDIALAEYVFQQSLAQGKGAMIRSFLPESWRESAAARAV